MLWIILALISAIFTGSKNILTKKLLKKEIPRTQIIFSEYLFLFIITTILFFNKINFTSIYFLKEIFLLKTITLIFFTFLFLHLLEKYDISLVTPLMNLSPLILLLFSYFFLYEKITNLQLIGIIITISSTYFLEVTIKHHKKNNPHKYHFINLKKLNYKFFLKILIMLISISITAITDKLILKKVNVYTDLFYTATIVLIAILSYYLFKKNLIKTTKNIIQNPNLFFISLFTNLGTYSILLAIQIPNAKLSLIIPIKRTSTLFSSIIGGKLFHEKHLFKKIIAIIIMLFGILLLVI